MKGALDVTRLVSAASFRWAAVIPAVLLAVVSAQIAIQFVMYRLFGAVGAGWTWGAKCMAAPLMGAAFVGVACWVAPSRQRLVAAVAFAVVAVWSVALMVSDPSTWAPSWAYLEPAGPLCPLCGSGAGERKAVSLLCGLAVRHCHQLDPS
jgi:hypothetical protein